MKKGFGDREGQVWFVADGQWDDGYLYDGLEKPDEGLCGDIMRISECVMGRASSNMNAYLKIYFIHYLHWVALDCDKSN